MSHILFLSPPFFSYPEVIKSELEKRFDKVSYYKATPSSRLYKFSWYLSSYLKINKLKDYLEFRLYKNIIKDIIKNNSKFDTVFVIKGSCVKDFFYEWMKSVFPDAYYIMYIWDDICNDYGSIEKAEYFDRVFSYNPDDCKRYNLRFRPFFFDEQIRYNCNDKKYELSCFISYSDDRASFMNKLLSQGISSHSLFFYIKSSRFLAFVKRKKNGKIAQYIGYKGVSYEKMMNVLAESKCQLDIQHPKQTGLTTRAFEALATNTKLITTNDRITEYDFYKPENIMIISRENPIINWDWVNMKFVDVELNIKKRYSLSFFIDEIFQNIK